jgi:hypothetical protein
LPNPGIVESEAELLIRARVLHPGIELPTLEALTANTSRFRHVSGEGDPT